MPRRLPVRGVIEGFYGPPWSPDARIELLEFVAEHAMNAYVYAPKSDAKHRHRWREPYDGTESDHFHVLATRAAAVGVNFGFAISPGLDIDYGGPSDRSALFAKLAPLVDAGVGWVVLALDDIPARAGLAADQSELAAWLLNALRARRPDVRLTLVPTEYVGTRPTPYLRELAAGLPRAVGVMWTGPTVCSPAVTAAQARAWAGALGGRRPLLWDNYPVNDGPMERAMHLGPYRGREPELSDEIDGVLCNPMIQARASKVALATAFEWLADPAAYEPEVAWRRALVAVGGPRAGALGALAAACADSALHPADDLEAHRLARATETGAGTENLREHLAAVRDSAAAWSGTRDDPLGQELAPWLAQARREAEAGLAALALVDCVRGLGDATGPPDPQEALVHVFAVILAWSAARAGDRTVFGPRFAVYPQVVQRDDGSPGVDVAGALVEDRCAIDRICRLALTEYRRVCGVPR